MQRLLSVTAIVIATTMATAGFAQYSPKNPQTDKIPQAAIDWLLENPTKAGGFDLEYGEGLAKVIFEANGIDTRTDAEKREDKASKRIQTANEVIPKGKFISTVAKDGFVIVYKGKVYQCRAYKANEIGCEQNPGK